MLSDALKTITPSAPEVQGVLSQPAVPLDGVSKRLDRDFGKEAKRLQSCSIGKDAEWSERLHDPLEKGIVASSKKSLTLEEHFATNAISSQ